MKTIITLLTLVLSLQTFSQKLFLKRKYTKGHFIEEIKHLKHAKKTDVVEDSISTTLHSIVKTHSEKINLVNDSMTYSLTHESKHEINSKVSNDSDIQLNLKPEKTYNDYGNIKRHNTILIQPKNVCSSASNFKSNTMEYQAISLYKSQKQDPGILSEIFDDFWHELLIVLLYALIIGLILLILALLIPPTSLFWPILFGLAILIGIVFGCIEAAKNSKNKKFLAVLKYIFIYCVIGFIVSLIVSMFINFITFGLLSDCWIWIEIYQLP